MEDQTERMKVIEQMKQQVEGWRIAESIACETCPFCLEEICSGDELCEDCGRNVEDDRAEYGTLGAQPLNIAGRVVTRIEITIGGPTCWLDYDHQRGQATFYSSYYGNGDTIALTPEESANVAELFGLEDRLTGLDADELRTELNL